MRNDKWARHPHLTRIVNKISLYLGLVGPFIVSIMWLDVTLPVLSQVVLVDSSFMFLGNTISNHRLIFFFKFLKKVYLGVGFRNLSNFQIIKSTSQINPLTAKSLRVKKVTKLLHDGSSPCHSVLSFQQQCGRPIQLMST